MKKNQSILEVEKMKAVRAAIQKAEKKVWNEINDGLRNLGLSKQDEKELRKDYEIFVPRFLAGEWGNLSRREAEEKFAENR